MTHPWHNQLNEFQKSIDKAEIYVKEAPPGEVATTSSKQRLRILSWNVERGYHPQQLAHLLNTVQPDIACLQEVDWHNRRTNEIDLLAFLATETGMSGYFGVEFYEIDSPDRGSKLAGGGVHGNALLTRHKPMWVERIELPQQFDWQAPPPWARSIARREKRIGGRFALCGQFGLGNQDVLVCSVHLEDKDGGVEGRVQQFQHLLKALSHRRQEDNLMVIGGDLNTLDNWLTTIIRINRRGKTGDKPWYVSECRWWREKVLPETGLYDPFSCSDATYERAGLYREKLDWILLPDGCPVLNYGVEDYHGSDHRPLWLDLALTG